MDVETLYEELRKGALYGARALLGWKLVHYTPEGRVAGYIVETEAYTQDDPASHSFKGQTIRNTAMFQEAGRVYIYFTYGMHYCLNIVTGEKGHGEAVLIRAIQPIEGLDIMEANRGRAGLELANGPAKLVEALGVNPKLNGHKLGEELILEPGLQIKENSIQTASRIGISKAVDELARYYIKDNRYVSKRA